MKTSFSIALVMLAMLFHGCTNTGQQTSSQNVNDEKDSKQTIANTLNEYCYNVITITPLMANSENSALMTNDENDLLRWKEKGMLTLEQEERFDRFYDLRQNEVTITWAESDDDRLLFYSYDANMGGTMTQFNVFAEIHDHGNYVTTINLDEEEEELGFPVVDVNTVKKSDGSVYYIVVRQGSFESAHGLVYAEAYALDGKKLRRVRVEDGMDDDSGTMFEPTGYDSAEWYYTSNLQVEGMYRYVNSNLYIPLTAETDDPELSLITDRYKVLHFNGKKFVEQQSNCANPYLPASLADYDHLVRYCQTRERAVRVDRLKDGSLRYAEWDTGVFPTNIEPVLVIANGKEVKTHDGTEYHFTKSDGTQYVVCHTECEPDANDGITYCTEYVIATQNGKQIFKEARESDY